MFIMFVNILLLLLPITETTTNYQSKSYAYDIDTEEFLYNEIHTDIYSEKSLIRKISKFVDENGELISRRQMIFNNNYSTPDFEIEDFRTGYKEGAYVISPNSVKVFKKESFEEPLEESILNIDGEFVIDGGLTYFFHEKWDKFINDEVISFYFVAPNRLDYYSFQVSKYDIIAINNRKGIRLLLEPSSFILQAFVDPVYITYDLNTKEILYYEGVSNVYDSEGNIYKVKIDYTKETK